MLANDEIRILHDAVNMRVEGHDYVETEGWERPLVDKLAAQGVLEPSLEARVLKVRSFRISAKGMELAKECWAIYENERREFCESFEAGLRALLEVGTAGRIDAAA